MNDLNKKNLITRRKVAGGVFFLLIISMGLKVNAKEGLDSWFKREKDVVLQKMLLNISPADGARGSVAASPSKENPNYYYHWVRDAALTMDVVERFDEKNFNLMMDYVEFSRQNQKINTLTGLGEPKFNIDGSAFNDPWGRPQNDGPALRAITLIHFANSLLEMGKENIVREKLYDGKLPTSSVIKLDLEYVSHHWQDTSFDLWEEVKGHHFYTRMVQRRALIEGASLAQKLDDPFAAEFYRSQAKKLESEIERHWNPERGIIVATLDRDGGLDYKTSGLDVAVILGVLHGTTDDGFMSVSDSRVLATAKRLEDAFQSLYSINQNGMVGIAIGRYPEDQYFGGNPWVLATFALAEFYYKLGEIKKGDEFMARVQLHANPDGSLSEQIDRKSGYMISARDLTWNYASFLTAIGSRNNLRVQIP